MTTKRTLQMILSVLAACIVGYFIYHTVQGDRGWLAMLRLQSRVAQQQQTLSQLQKEHEEMDRRIHMMRPDSMDPDLLDEQARKTLDYSKPGETVILTPPDNTSKK